MASIFGVIKKIFGGGAKPAANETVQDTASEQQGLNQANEPASSTIETVAETVTETVTETVDHVAEAAAATVTDVANSELVQEAERVAIAAAGAVGGVSGAMTEAVTDMVQTATASDEVPQLPPLALKATIDYLDRDHFVVPRSDMVVKAIELIDNNVGPAATARGLRIFEYGVAAGHAYQMRVDREILCLAALLGQLGEGAPAKAEAFCIENGMWEALAQKVAFAIETATDGLTVNDVEARAVALGVAAELADGEVDYVHVATAAETRNKNAA